MATLTFPISKSAIQVTLKDAMRVGEGALSDFLEENFQLDSEYCINWATINLSAVDLCIDEDATMTLLFRFSNGLCHRFNDNISGKIRKVILDNYKVEVTSEW